MPYRIKLIDIINDEQFNPTFLSISPNNKIPAIVDHDTRWGRQSLFESGAILQYLAEKGDRILAADGARRAHTLQ